MFRVWCIGIVLGLAMSIASAKDFCVQTDTGAATTLLVAKGFAIPGHGKCKPWSGFTSNFHGNGLYQASGTACTASDDSHVTMSSMAIPHDNATGSRFLYGDTMDLPLPALTGGTEFFVIGASNLGTTVTAAMIACPTQPMPVP